MTEVKDWAPSLEGGGEHPDINKNLRETQEQTYRNNCLHRTDASTDRQQADRTDQ